MAKMEQFEKWWNEVSMEGDWDYEKYAKLGWEEALDWVLKDVCFNKDRVTQTSHEIRTNISRELDGNK